MLPPPLDFEGQLTPSQNFKRGEEKGGKEEVGKEKRKKEGKIRKNVKPLPKFKHFYNLEGDKKVLVGAKKNSCIVELK